MAQQVVEFSLSPAADMLWSHGDTLRLNTGAFDANGHAVEDPELIWSSTDPSVARVDSEGLVTTAAAGSAEITAGVAGSGLTSSAALHVVLPTPRDVLVILYNATAGLNWNNSQNWLTDAPLGSWQGVATRSPADDVIEGLDLRNNGLAGALPPQLGALADLETLILPSNVLVGSIPPQFRHLRELQTLWLSDNELSGPIPRSSAAS